MTAQNFSMISEYMTPFGQIKHSDNTSLRPRNQRKMAKAIRRVIGMGIHPSVHRHPEILRHELQTNQTFKLRY
jgi:small subunit ribosomal protein S18